MKHLLKRAFITSFFWCLFLTVVGFLLLIAGIYKPTGYIRWVNPFVIFTVTYWFFLASTMIHLILMNKMNLNKWFTALIGVVIVYFGISIPLIFDGDYFDNLDWKVPLFILLQIVLLVKFDEFVKKIIFKKKRSTN